jgi:hypothetical protein
MAVQRMRKVKERRPFVASVTETRYSRAPPWVTHLLTSCFAIRTRSWSIQEWSRFRRPDAGSRSIVKPVPLQPPSRVDLEGWEGQLHRASRARIVTINSWAAKLSRTACSKRGFLGSAIRDMD